MLKKKSKLSVDECLYTLMNFGVLYNRDDITPVEQRHIKKQMNLFIFQNIVVCKQAVAKFDNMSNEERTAFYTEHTNNLIKGAVEK
jgi:hypothetical protein